MEIFELKGKTAVVTGAATGIGKATAELFEQAGATVARIDINPLPGIISGDVADESAMERAFGKIGAVDILVNNAGIAVRKNALEITREEWDQVIGVNLSGLFLCSRIAARSMKQPGKDGLPRGGVIVNLASIMGFSGGLFPNPAYQASKGAVVNLTRALALEFAEYRIRVNAVAPTFVRTKLTEPVFSNPQVLEKVMQHAPLGVLPEVNDIAAAILFLAGSAARCITGVTLPVDSGYLAR
ncbi:MAG: SDR family oxidoreductase [Betaproteobacteria bacterium]|nr:SDR family oxidoreductase [Betaproteobacteria bacterium]